MLQGRQCCRVGNTVGSVMLYRVGNAAGSVMLQGRQCCRVGDAIQGR